MSDIGSAQWFAYFYQKTTSHSFRSTKLGELLGCKQTDPAQLQDCMQAADVNDLVVQQNLVTTGGIPFEPIVDGVFLPDSVQVCIS